MSEAPTWEKAPESPRLGSDALHVWRLDLAPDREQPPPSRTWLSADERQRADRFRDSQGSARFVIARSAVRTILGRYLDTDPQALEFDYGTQGKPMLAPPHAWLSFNLSHCRDLGLLAVTAQRALGADVEKVSPRSKLPEIARRVFTRKQLDTLNRAQGDAWLRMFFENWTALEARLKARGLGVFDRDADRGLQGMLIRHFLPHTGYVAAVAVAADPGPPAVWDYFSYSGISDSETV